MFCKKLYKASVMLPNFANQVLASCFSLVLFANDLPNYSRLPKYPEAWSALYFNIQGIHFIPSL